MSVLTKFSDSIKAIRLDAVGDTKAAAVTTSASRLASIKAAASDPKRKEAYMFAKAGVERLGFALDAIAASGGIVDLNRRMTEMKWKNERRMQLKAALHAIGAIS